MNETTIIIQGDDIRIYALMMALRDLGCFDIRYGKVEISFDGEKKVSNIQITTNHRSLDLTP